MPNQKRIAGWLSLLLLLSGCAGQEAHSPDLIVEVDSGAHTRTDSIVSIRLPDGVENVRIAEVTETGFLPVAGQLSQPPQRLFWRLAGVTPSRSIRTFHLFREAPVRAESALAVEDREGEYLEIQHSGRPVFRYRYGIVQPPTPDVPGIYARNAYIHPIWTPKGRIVSDDFAPDHLHQRGLWFAWTQARFKGRSPDFWNLAKGTGTVAHAGVGAVWRGPVFAGFRSSHTHMDLSAPTPEAVLDEEWEVRVSIAGGPGSDVFLFDLSSVQSCAGSAPLELPEYHYGGMAFRGARGWTPDVMRLRTSQGLTRKPADASRADWCLISGPVEGGEGSLLLMSHPDNFRAPQPLRVHPDRPYFTFAPQRLGPMEIGPDRPYRSRYRVAVFDREPGQDRIQSLWNDYADPPTVSIAGGLLSAADSAGGGVE